MDKKSHYSRFDDQVSTFKNNIIFTAARLLETYSSKNFYLKNILKYNVYVLYTY